MPIDYPRIDVKRKNGEERFRHGKQPLDTDLRSFWQWSASDLVSNATRGVLAEYIVANALGIAGGIRAEWDAFDLLWKPDWFIKRNVDGLDGIRIEVKSAAYLQTWYHKNLSKISYSIRPARVWSDETGLLSTELQRNADVYVFCILAHQEQNTLDPLDLDQWEFYILRSDVLDQACPTQKTIGLTSLLRLDPLKARYDELANSITAAVLPANHAKGRERERGF